MLGMRAGTSDMEWIVHNIECTMNLSGRLDNISKHFAGLSVVHVPVTASH